MGPTPSSSPAPPDRPRSALARAGEIEGWLSIVFTALVLFLPFANQLLYAFLFGIAALFALSGLRYGYDLGKVAAAISINLLGLLLLTLGVANLIGWWRSR